MPERGVQPPARLRRYLALCNVLGLVAVGATTALAVTGPGFGNPFTVASVGLVVAVAARVRVELPLGERALSMNLAEVGIVLGLVALPGPAVVPLVVGATLLADLMDRPDAEKLAYNASVTAIGASAAVGLLTLLGPVGSLTEPGSLLALTAALVTYGALNILAAGVLLSRLEGLTVRSVLHGLLLGSLVTLGLSGSLGYLVALLLEVAPAALPVLALPAWIAHRALAERVTRIRRDLEDRDRLERTLEGASDGIALLDGRGVVELANPALASRLGVVREDLVGARLLGLLGEEALELEDASLQLTADDPNRTADLHLDDQVYAITLTGLFDRLGLRTGTVVLLFDVTEQREAEWLRRELMARVSHELRTPLTAIQGFAETLLEHDAQLGHADRVRYLTVIRRQSERLARLVSTLLWSARIERQRAEAAPEDVPLAEAVAEVVQSLGEVLVEPPEVRVGELQVRVDPDHLQQVLTNLLVNAATYGRLPVRVDARTDGRRVRVAVSDAGDGVPAEFAGQLFAPFAQASMGDQRTSMGLGLGLSIVRALVEGNGGGIAYRRVGGRTQFVLELPAVATTADP